MVLFVDAGKDVAMQIAAMKPIAVDEKGVSKDVIEKEIEIGKELARVRKERQKTCWKNCNGQTQQVLQRKYLCCHRPL